MKVLFISSPGDASAAVLAALCGHAELVIDVAPDVETARADISRDAPDAIVVMSPRDAKRWGERLATLTWSGLTLVVMNADDNVGTDGLPPQHDVLCLTEETIGQPFFPALLHRLVHPPKSRYDDPAEVFDEALNTLTRERDQLMALTSIDQQILAMSDSPHVVIEAALGHALRLLQLPKGISVLAPYTQRPEMIHTHGIEDRRRATELVRTNWTRDSRWYESRGPGRHLAVESVSQTSPDFKAWADSEDILAMLAIPLWLQGKVVGLLSLFDTQPRHWHKEEIRVAAMLASQATIALDKAMLVQQLRRRLRQAEEAVTQLQHFDALKRQFIQNVSHELRTPLAIVKGYVDLLSSGNLGEQQDTLLRQGIQAIHTHTDNLVRLVESITTLGDVEIGRLHLAPQPVQPICEAALRAIWQQALRRDITIVPEITETLPVVELDAQGLLRALNHVLENAVKFSPEGSEIRFESFVSDGAIWFRVVDHGIGIAPSELERIFERFYQVHGESTRRYGGMGIGLSVVKEVVQAHQGEVWAESLGEGHGTTISIALPIRQTPLVARPRSGVAA